MEAGTRRVALGAPAVPWAARLALVPAGFAFGLVAEWMRGQVGWPGWWMALDFVAGAAFLSVGGIAWRRRPGNRIGPLMIAAGFAWFAGTYAASRNPTIDEIAYALGGSYDALLAWIVLAYPTGHLAGRASRFTVAALLAVVVARAVFRLWIYQPTTAYDLLVPSEVDRFIADQQVRATGEDAFGFLTAVLLVPLVVLILLRFRSSTAVGRRVAGPMLLGGLVLAAGLALEIASSVVDVGLGVPDQVNAGFLLLTTATIAVPIAFGAGLVRARAARAAVADLVVELDRAPEAPRLRDVLARALGDPSLEIAYPAPDGDRFVGPGGRPVTLPAPSDATRAVTRLERDGRIVAALIHDPALSEESELVASVGAATSLALENERLQAEVRAQLEEVRASRARIVAAGDAERRRIERDLHDGAQQRLVTLALILQMAQDKVGGSPELEALIEKARGELEGGLTELRELARGLHPVALDEGLAGAVESLAERVRVPVAVHVPSERYPSAVEATAYFVVAEALTNVVRYAEATRARVAVTRSDDVLVVEVSDDGVGGADPARGSGLRGLADRVSTAGGRLSVTSPTGGGTTLRAEIPCA